MTVLSTPLLQRILQFIKPQSRRLPGIACCIAVAGCSQFTGPSGFRYLPGINSATYDRASSYRILHNYGYGTDGSGPAATLLDINDTLYGTTPWGGANGAAELWGGSVFSLSSTGKERVLHSFGNGSDGNQPCAGLLDLNRVLYGTTRSGGADSRGTVFRIGTTGANYRVLHSFGTVKGDGIFPFAPLVAVSGMLYGTTSGGGAYSGGAVFSISASGANYRVLHSFGKGSDGVNSQAGLLAVKGALYGTTAFGGSARKCPFPYYSVTGCGTVFSISTGGTNYRVLHRFGKGSDGIFPYASLIDLDGLLYGTTRSGGVHDAGTIFSISATGIERVVYSASGTAPAGWSGLAGANGTLYGTYPGGGTYYGGIVFSISTTGSGYRALHSFAKGSDGGAPWAALIDVKGTLYGTTTCGGRYGASFCGDNGFGGTVFELTP